MNISSSISQVIYQTQLPGKILLQKAYIWPQYDAGKVQSINPVHEKTEPELNYVKRSSFNSSKENIVPQTLKNSEYNPKGNILSTLANYTPGSLFEAVA